MSKNILTSKEIGNYYEDDGVSYLIKNGFEIIERNFYAKWGEIDIIASKDGVVHFVEVKGGETFEPIYNITPSKLKKIIKTALGYLQKKSLDTPFCIDALIVKNGKIDFMENITI